MVEEYDSIVHNSVWDVVPRPKDKSVASFSWIYKVKQAADGSVEKHKARFVARGFSQVEGIDYDEMFALVARYSSIKSILALSAQMDDDWLIKYCKEDLARESEMKDMGPMHYFLGMEVWKGDGELFVSQGKYANKILSRFHVERRKSMETPLTGNWKKEDVTLGEEVEVNQLSQAMVRPTKLYWKATKHVLIYLRGTYEYGSWYKWREGVKLQGFIDADLAGIPFDRKSK
eukprot:PITA_08057